MDSQNNDYRCGVDFCDLCGDCLACYWDSACPSSSGEHSYVSYGEDDDL